MNKEQSYTLDVRNTIEDEWVGDIYLNSDGNAYVEPVKGPNKGFRSWEDAIEWALENLDNG